jgi:predicted DNA-binding antitoxin AbrB/MazE fold protein
MSKCTYGRWAIINKEGHEFGNLGWFTNSDKADVLAYCKEHDIKIQEGEDVKVVEETEKFEGHLTPLRKVTMVDKKITEEDFKEYEDCRQSGITNMFHVSNVEMVTGLSRGKIIYIIKNYSDLRKKYMGGK